MLQGGEQLQGPLTSTGKREAGREQPQPNTSVERRLVPRMLCVSATRVPVNASVSAADAAVLF